jgi:hypothetical protein
MKHRIDRAVIAVAVMLLHGLLFLGWRAITVPVARGQRAPESTAVILRLLPPVRLEAEEAPRPPTAPRARAPSAAPALSLQSAAAPSPQAITLQAATPPPPTASAPDSRALELALPRAAAAPAARSMKDQMLNDPRANSPKPSVDTRVAAVAGTPELVEERIDATRTRFRRNGQCVEVHVSRNAQLDPWNQSHLPTPKIVKPGC